MCPSLFTFKESKQKNNETTIICVTLGEKLITKVDSRETLSVFCQFDPRELVSLA